MHARRLYWICQLSGWFSYATISVLLTISLGKPLNYIAFIAIGSVVVLGLILSHLYRFVILQLDWLRFSIAQLIPRMLLGSLVFGAILELLYAGVVLLVSGVNPFNKLILVVQDYSSWTLLFLLWSALYFFYHFFKNYKSEEIKNLQWQARENELNLRRLRSQLNPHFIFNAMNSIRALVDEDPAKAKKSITQLSNVLRSSLLTDKKRLIDLKEEISLVKDYLEIERARYEERLRVKWAVEEASLSGQVPPMLLQTLVENGIKHGISKLPKGGEIEISSKVREGQLFVEVINTGTLKKTTSDGTGYGLTSTRERLDILFEGKASFHISESNGQVHAKITIPKL
ncbi:histidine kinase [Salibacteraceae bacterium]|nr:histidine kinase [Salibacteraceae bacterium]